MTYVSHNETTTEMRQWNPVFMRVIEAQIEREDQWMDATMRAHVPERIYRWAHSGLPFALRKVAEWLEREGIRQERWLDGRIRVVRGAEVLGELNPREWRMNL